MTLDIDQLQQDGAQESRPLYEGNCEYCGALDGEPCNFDCLSY